MADPFTVGGVFSAISTTFKLAEFGLALKEVSAESQIFLDLIQRVRTDLDEANRERYEKAAILQIMPGKRDWIDKAIDDVKSSLTQIGLVIENARIDVAKGKKVTLYHRFKWVLDNKQKFVMREKALGTCHVSLLAAIQAMHSLTMSPPMLSHSLAERKAAPVQVSAFGSTTSLASMASNGTFSAPPEYDQVPVSYQAVNPDSQILKSPLRRRPKPMKVTSAPTKESLIPSYGHDPSLRHQHSDCSIQDSILEVRSLSDTSYLQLPNFNLPSTNLDLYTTDDTHPRTRPNSVPDLNIHHDDSISSIASEDAANQSFPYFDPTNFEFGGPYLPPKTPTDVNDAGAAQREKNESSSTRFDLQGRTLSNAQELRRRARARFEAR
ncbi:MAG: hypothetical protein Q9191_001122 [Dirinaria sp. TL-2023a]